MASVWTHHPYNLPQILVGAAEVTEDKPACNCAGMVMIEAFHEFTFDAAHKTTPDTPLHGHTFKVKVVLTGKPVPVFGWSHDLLEVQPIINGLRARLDHKLLNDIPGLETPTLENVAGWIWKQLDEKIVGVDRVEVRRGVEGAGEGVLYRGRA